VRACRLLAGGLPVSGFSLLWSILRRPGLFVCSLRWRLLLVLLVILVPLVLAMGGALYVQREHFIRRSELGTRDLVRLITAQQSALIADARHTVQALSLVAHLDEVQLPDCQARLAQFARQDSRFVYVAVADTRGELLCAVDGGTDPQMRARMLGSARAAAASGADALWEPVANDTTVLLVHRLTGGARDRIVIAALCLEWLHRQLPGQVLPAGAVMSLVDAQGTIRLRTPDPEKRRLTRLRTPLPSPASPEPQVMRRRTPEGVDSVRAFAALPGAGLRVVLDVPLTAARASTLRLFWNNFAGLGATLLFAIVIAPLLARRFLLRPLDELARLARRLARGERPDESRPFEGPIEFRELALAFTDMAQRVAARERGLKEAEEKYRSLVEQSLVGVYLLAPDRLLYANRAAAQIFGYEPDEVIGHSVAGLIHPDDREMVAARIANRTEGRAQVDHYTFRGLTRDGRTIVCEVFGRVVRHENAPCILGTLIDISERARAEQALRESETRFRSVAESANDAMVCADAAGRITFWNQAATTVFGYSEAEVIGESVAMLMPERYRDLHHEGVARHATSRESPVLGRHLQLHGLRRDGTEFPLELSVAQWSVGGEQYYTGIIRDMTEHHELAEQFRHAQKMEAVGRLAGGVAHDFNNLLTAILGYCELLTVELEHELKSGHRSLNGLEEIRAAGERAASLTRQLLAFSRKQVLQPRRLSVNSVVASIEPMLRRLIGEDVSLVFMPGEGVSDVEADPAQIEQVLVNLVVNARDAMPHGGSILIESDMVDLEAGDPVCGTVPPGRYVALTVTDNGDGIPEHVFPHIFEPFFTTKEVGKGTGLGLSTVYGIVRQSKGYISVKSEPEAGSSFRIYLPPLPAECQESAARPPLHAEATGSAAEPLPAAVVLVVEDDDQIRALVTSVLARAGYRVLSARHANEAVALASRTDRIDLLLTDVIMPGSNGPELAQRLTLDRPAMRVLYISGYTEHPAVRLGALNRGISFLQKPFAGPVLLRAVRGALEAGAA